MNVSLNESALYRNNWKWNRLKSSETLASKRQRPQKKS